MKMLKFKSIIERFNKKGEKTGWSYIEFSQELIEKLQPNTKKSFRVKGRIDEYEVKQLALLPMGDGSFILPLNNTIRKAIKKRQGETVTLELTIDKSKLELDEDLIACLEDSPDAKKFFFSLTPSHRSYFSKWISSAKTEATKAKRIAQTIKATEQKMGYPEMIRANKQERG